MYRRGSLVTRGGKELTVIGSIKSGAWHPKWRLVVSARFLREAYLKSNRTFCDIADAASTNKMPLAPTVIQFWAIDSWFCRLILMIIGRLDTAQARLIVSIVRGDPYSSANSMYPNWLILQIMAIVSKASNWTRVENTGLPVLIHSCKSWSCG